MGYYFINKFSERDNVFPKSKIGQCRLLPIRKCEPQKQFQFISLIDEILKNKSKDISINTTALENQIDQLVYQLYELTDEEIKIIEAS